MESESVKSKTNCLPKMAQQSYTQNIGMEKLGQETWSQNQDALCSRSFFPGCLGSHLANDKPKR